jgi:hypothetical protein
VEATTFAFTKFDQTKKHDFSMMFGVRASMKQTRAGVSFQLHKKVIDSHGHCSIHVVCFVSHRHIAKPM